MKVDEKAVSEDSMDMNKVIEEPSCFTINRRKRIREVFKKQIFNDEKFILVVDDDDKVMGIVTDGDFRRSVWNSVSLDDSVDLIANRNFIYLSEKDDKNKVREIFEKKEVNQIPILKDGILVDLIFRKAFSKNEIKPEKEKLDVPVVIMAGGSGTRLDPFTRVLPKPLIPIGEKPVIEIIIDKFVESGAQLFYLSLHHKAKMIKAFFEEVVRTYSIFFIEEEKPLGTAGALRFLRGKVTKPIIVSNCDTIIEADYNKILDFHNKNEYLLTLVASMHHHVIPYGVCEIQNGGELAGLKEKPEYDVLINTGMYIVSPGVLDFIPEDKKFDITELVDVLKQNKLRVGVYPIPEKSWIDVGQWEEYRKAARSM
ncbi:MAG: sugar phosphate nucleotidyltransferase [Candidatus Omnitrophota bacterium]